MTCAWEPDPGCLGDSWTGLDPEVQRRSLMLATSSLQALTNNRVGACPITIRPCPEVRRCRCAWNPQIGTDGLWRNTCAHATPCGSVSEIDLAGPVGYIDSFRINGDEVDFASDWRLDNGHLLVWQGGGASPVPDTQDLSKPDTEPGTYSITYSRSYPVNEDARLAVTVLAMEFAKACKPKGKCDLPRGVTSVVRSGVTFSIEAGLFPNRLTGLDVPDQFILKWRPPGSPDRTAVVIDPRRRTRVSSPIPVRNALGSD